MAPSVAFLGEMARKRGSQPKTKIEFVSKAGVTTDISRYYLAGANLEQVKERAPDEIQSGQFDILLSDYNNTFSEYVAGGLFSSGDYHGARIKIYQGFILPDGTSEYLIQGVGYIDQLIADPETSQVTLRCRDRLWQIMDQKIHIRPTSELPVANGANVGNGRVSMIDTKPFVTVNQTWTLNCTLGGVDSVATFSVVGSVSGSIGPATSGVEFVSTAAGLKFTIHVGTLNWVLNDKFTFSTRQHPQWTTTNLGKIIWSILTGYNYDTNVQENFSAFVFDFDHTLSSSNIDIDYDSFVTAIANITTLAVFNITGYANYDTDAIEFLQNLLVQVLGSLYTGSDGRVKLQVYVPNFNDITTTFSDNQKITRLGYNRTIDEVINSVTVDYIATPIFPFSDSEPDFDGTHVKKSSTSITNYKELGVSFTVPWYTASGLHVQDFADKLVARYSSPPLNIEFETGMDALQTNIGDFIGITDTKYGIQAVVGEVAMIRKQFDSRPTKIQMILRRDASFSQIFGFIGSSANEGDGESPQTDDYTSATPAEKAKFAYFGDAGSPPPDYRIF